MTKNAVLERSFIEVRSQLLDVAAFLDRIGRAEGDEDYRLASFRACIPVLADTDPEKTKRILEILSDPTTEPIETAPGQGATGAWPDFKAE